MAHPLDYAASPSPLRQRLLRAVHFSAAAFPLLNFGGFYGAWLLAWVILGHRPVAGFDDPMRVLGNAYYAAVLLMVLFPLGMILGLGSVVILCITRRAPGRAILWAIALAGLWVAVFALARWDPYGVGVWLAD